MLFLFAILYFNPIAFIKANKVTQLNKTWGDFFRGRNAKVHVLSRAPNWKLLVKQAKLLGEDYLEPEMKGREEIVEGTANVTECDVGYRIITAEEDFWAPNVSGGYVCGKAFYASPHPSKTQQVDVPGCLIVLVLGMLVSGLILSPNIIDIVQRMKNKEEEDKKISTGRTVAFIFSGIFLFFVSFVAVDMVLEKFSLPHTNRIIKENCYVIANYTDKFADAGQPEVVKNFRKQLKTMHRMALNRKLMKRMAKGNIANTSRSWKLLQAGLLADAETPFIQQASMTDLGNNVYRFRVPCGAAISTVSTKEGVPQISYQWYPQVTYSAESVDMTFVELARSHKVVWCKGSSSKNNLEKWKKDNGWDYADESKPADWFVLCTTCTWSRQFGKCMYGFKYAPAGNFILRKVQNNKYGGYLMRGTTDGRGFLNWEKINPADAMIENITMFNSYENRKGGWLENMSHTIMQNDWDGWDYSKRHEAMSHWRSAMIPSQNEGEVQAALRGMRRMTVKKKDIECNVEMDITATTRPTNDTCYTEFDMVVQEGTRWQEVGEACKAVYASKVGDKISVAVDTGGNIEEESKTSYCSITLTIGTMEKMYYIRPGEPWVGYHLDAWRCKSVDNGTRGIECNPRKQPEAVNYEVFSGILPVVIEQTTHYVPEEGLFGDVGEKIQTAIALVITAIVLVVLVFLGIKFGPKIIKGCKKMKKKMKNKNDDDLKEVNI